MSECVVRMEMPQNCYGCDLRYECNAFYAPGKPKPFMKGCMIVCQLPEGHGRLVDEKSVWHRVEEPPKKTGKYAACWIYQEKFYWDWLIFIDGNWVLQAGLPLPDSGLPLPDYWMPIEPPKEE